MIDKDKASGLLALNVNADLYLISTGVEKVALNFGQLDQIEVDEMTIDEVKVYMAGGQFALGSMLPKVEACIHFLEQSPNPDAYALITNPPNLLRALQGETGTRIVRA